ncbi:SEC-C metal-binding domain-containing protein [Lysinibacillus sp. NPDC047702]|uniref:SEC-C metal-binding domain-containing protein n=1 Tax=unclassified Lysinibacillus TaxID=2636778 RepID=UPI003D03CB79
MQSKNTLCVCGSGKKFKMCCMNKQIIEIQDSHFNPPYIDAARKELHRNIHSQLFENILQEHQGMVGLNLPRGLRSLVLYRMHQILQELKETVPNDSKIKAYLAEIYWIFYNGQRDYKESIQKIAKLSDTLQLMIVESEHLSDQAVEIIYEQTAGAILLDYAFKTVDYGAFKVLIQFCIQFLQLSAHQIPVFNHVRLYVGTEDELEDFELLQTNSVFSNIYFEMIASDIVYNELQIAKLNYMGLSDDSLKAIATAIASEKTLNTNPEYISYTGMCMSYFGVIEDELRRMVYNKMPKLQNKKIMWAELTGILPQIKLPILEQMYPQYIDQMKKFNPLRNLAAHGKRISTEEFSNLKKFLFEENFLIYLSWQVNEEVPTKMLDNLVEGTIDVLKTSITVDETTLVKSEQENKKAQNIKKKQDHEALLKQYENEIFTLFKFPQKTLTISIHDLLNEKVIHQIIQTHNDADIALLELARNFEDFDLLRAYCASLSRAGLYIANLILGECLINKGNKEEIQEGIRILEKLEATDNTTAVNFLILYYSRIMKVETDEDQTLQIEKIKYYANRHVQLGNELGYAYLADIYLYEDKFEKALEYAQKSLKTNDPVAYQTIGKILLARGHNIDQAIDYLKKSLAQQEYYSTALLLCEAALHDTIRDIELAEKCLYLALDLFKPDDFKETKTLAINFEELAGAIQKYKTIDSSAIQKLKTIQATYFQNN